MGLCDICQARRAVLKRSKTLHRLCKECFFDVFETEVHHVITDQQLFKRGDKVAIGASGGKDSTVLAYVMKKLNEQYDYGLDLFLLSIDEGITGYRDDSLETVKRNQQQYDLPLKIVSYSELYGWSMDMIVQEVGLKNNCTFCGVFRRQALDRGAAMLGVDHVITGHNADDIAETVLMNLLRGDIARLGRCTKIQIADAAVGDIKRSKPFKYAYEKDIVLYAYYKKLDYFSTECTYSPGAYRGFARTFLKDIERERPSSILDIIRSGETFEVKETIGSAAAVPSECQRCGYMTSGQFCKACILLEGLNRGLPKMGITRKGTRALQDAPLTAAAETHHDGSSVAQGPSSSSASSDAPPPPPPLRGTKGNADLLTPSAAPHGTFDAPSGHTKSLERFGNIAVNLDDVIR